MRVTEDMTFDQYWNAPRFRDKRPNLDPKAPLERAFGDCFYYRCAEDTTKWYQIPADHCEDSSFDSRNGEGTGNPQEHNQEVHRRRDSANAADSAARI